MTVMMMSIPTSASLFYLLLFLFIYSSLSISFSLPSLCSLYPHYPRSIILWSFQVTSTMPPIPNAGAHTVLLPLPVRRMVFSGVPRGGLAYAPSIPQEGQSAKAAIWRVQCIVNGVRWVDLLLLLLSEILR